MKRGELKTPTQGVRKRKEKWQNGFIKETTKGWQREGTRKLSHTARIKIMDVKIPANNRKPNTEHELKMLTSQEATDK